MADQGLAAGDATAEGLEHFSWRAAPTQAQHRAPAAGTGARVRDTVLSLGGSRAPAEVFKAFRGRVASSEALIRHSGLQAA